MGGSTKSSSIFEVLTLNFVSGMATNH